MKNIYITKEPPRKRLFISNGAYTSMLLSAIIKDLPAQSKNFNVLLGYFKNISNKKLQEDIASCSFEFTRKLNFFDYLKRFKVFNKKVFQSHTNYNIFDDIYLPINSTTLKWFKIFKSMYPKAQFHFYEEGMMSYIKPIFSGKLRKILSQYKCYYVFYTDNLKNLLSYFCPKINPISINKEDINTIIDAINTKFNVQQEIKNIINHKDISASNYAVVLPQYYYQNNKKKYQVLKQQYLSNIQILINKGYTVLFKEHPKASFPLYNILQTNLQNPEKFVLLKGIEGLPFEVLLLHLKPKLVFSSYSTALFTSKYFGFISLTSIIMLNYRIKWYSIFPSFTCMLTRSNISNIENNTIYEKVLPKDTFKTKCKVLNYLIYNVLIKFM